MTPHGARQIPRAVFPGGIFAVHVAVRPGLAARVDFASRGGAKAVKSTTGACGADQQTTTGFLIISISHDLSRDLPSLLFQAAPWTPPAGHNPVIQHREWLVQPEVHGRVPVRGTGGSRGCLPGPAYLLEGTHHHRMKAGRTKGSGCPIDLMGLIETLWHAGDGVVGIIERGAVAGGVAKHTAGPHCIGGGQGWSGLNLEVASEHGG